METKKTRSQKRKERARIRKILASENRLAHAKLPKQKKPKIVTPSKDDKQTFYASWAWRTLRMEVLNEYGRRCMCCGSTPEHTDMSGLHVKIVVDHIKPIHHYWPWRLRKDNLQVLCDECNQGKGAWDETDHRPKPAPDEWVIEDDGIPESLREQLRYTH